ncbi:hypothetical protein PIIN_05596 [Serendipita indica DSM 11827]|uniref:Uncharacterized protein n=1 Tax=Serendipita indica (strain DSM 11827) TaxID=1109443 RepID=G4TK10_SERID|nr:hypothetical protein PIIN_05596 [Serendipita indica DSM 11827]
MQTPPEQEVGARRHSKHFRTALNLVHKKSATAWTIEEFQACVGTWGEENPEKAASMRVQIGEFLQQTYQEKSDEILERYKAYEGIDSLSEAIDQAKVAAASSSNPSRRRRSSMKQAEGTMDPKEARISRLTGHVKCIRTDDTQSPDVWKPDIAPRTAVHAVTVPLLEAERQRLEKALAEACFPLSIHLYMLKLCQVEKLAEESLARCRENREKAIEAKVQASRIMDRVEQAKESFEAADMNEIESWTLGRLTGQGNP